MIDMSEPQWYVLQTQFGYETIAKSGLEQMVEANNLQDFIFEVVMPEEEIITEKNGKTTVKYRKKYPNYLFIKMIYTKNTWYMVKQTRGVKDFCSDYQGKPLPMSQEEVKRAQLEKIKIEDLDFMIGDVVNITTGAFAGHVGEVKAINADSEKITVGVSMFGKETPIDLDFNQAEKLN